MAKTKQTAKKAAGEVPAPTVHCPDCVKMFMAKRAMDRHRVLKHGRHANGMAASDETIARYGRHGRHKPKVPVEVPATAVSAIEIDGSSADEVSLAVASILPGPIDEISPLDLPSIPDRPVRPSEMQTGSVVATAAAQGKRPRQGKTGTEVVKRAVPGDTGIPVTGSNPTVRRPTKPAMWCRSARAAKAECQRLGGPRAGAVVGPAHRKRPLTPGRLVKIVGRRPDMTVTALTEFVASRYSLTPEAMRHVHNQILVARAMDRRRCRKVHDLIPAERTAEATTGFYVSLSQALREVGSSGSDDDFI